MREDTVKKSYQKNYCLSIQKYIFQSIRIINFKSNIVTIYKQPDTISKRLYLLKNTN